MWVIYILNLVSNFITTFRVNIGGIEWRHSNMNLSRLIYIMEVVKNALLNNEEIE